MHKNEASALEYRALFIFTEIPFYLEAFHVFPSPCSQLLFVEL
jgi:hypothetical protein